MDNDLLHKAMVHGLLKRVEKKHPLSARRLYKIFVERTLAGVYIDRRLTEFVCNNLEKVAEGEGPKKALKLDSKRGKTADPDRDWHIGRKFVELMDEKDTDKPSHVQDEVGKLFSITGDQAIRIYIKQKKSGSIDMLRAITITTKKLDTTPPEVSSAFKIMENSLENK